MTDKGREAIKTTFLTPCRNVGLKRRSLGSNPQSKSVETIPKNSLNEPVVPEEKQDSTPKRPLLSSCCRQQSSTKKFKNYVNTFSVKNLEDNNPVFQAELEELRNESITQPDYHNSVIPSKPNEFQNDSALQPVPEKVRKNDILAVDAEISKTKESISKKMNAIKALELDSLNAKQHDLETLHLLIKKWRTACQQALTELHTEYTNRGETGSMSVLLHTLGIPPKLVLYSDTEMDFYEI